MRVLLYNRIDPDAIPGFTKLRVSLERGDFRSADVRKVDDNLYRARLDRSNRVLFKFYEHEGERCVLVVEYIPRHEYDKSRFLKRGARLLDEHLPAVTGVPDEGIERLTYLNPNHTRFHLLNKVISFDDDQDHVYGLPAPMIVVGSAGSGKTALTLERLKLAEGNALYVTRSDYLVGNSRDQYYSLGYRNGDQEVSFLSLSEYLASIRVPVGRAATFRDFAAWFAGHRQSTGLKDAYQVFEEFAGVITGNSFDAPYLSAHDYSALGVRQSIFGETERPAVHALFMKYLEFLERSGLYDPNILSHSYLQLVEPTYDFIVVDEVQDFTTVQLKLVLSSLRQHDAFILCGDSNQIVHPNFFSWSRLKTLFYEDAGLSDPAALLQRLTRNYRNSPEVTELANRVLRLKIARFGSVDRESTYLVESMGSAGGKVLLLRNSEDAVRELDERTRRSTRFAVIVLDADQKPRARAAFGTPLVFTVQEAKGLEYDSIILYDVASSAADRFRQIAAGVGPDEVAGGEPRYARVRDKSDRSLEIYKFHINALYVAVTRALKNVYLVESDPAQDVFGLLGLSEHQGEIDLDAAESSLADWRQEARRLERQGKTEQAEEIRSQVLGIREVPWQVLTGSELEKLEESAIEGGNRKARLLLFEYALVHRHQRYLGQLARAGFKPAMQPLEGALPGVNQKHFYNYDVRRTDLMHREVERYGVDHRNQFNQTPLMAAARIGTAQHVHELIDLGADQFLVDNAGLNAFQIMLQHASLDPAASSERLAHLYLLLAPRSLTLQVDGRLIKLDRDSPEFLLFNLMYAAFYDVLSKGLRRHSAFSTAELLPVLEFLPEEAVPEYRRRRQYVTSILSGNERDRDAPRNKRLFLRLTHGNYTFNPAVSLFLDGKWRPIYEVLSLDALSYPLQFRYQFDDEIKERLDQINEAKLKSLIARLTGDGTAFALTHVEQTGSPLDVPGATDRST